MRGRDMLGTGSNHVLLLMKLFTLRGKLGGLDMLVNGSKRVGLSQQNFLFVYLLSRF